MLRILFITFLHIFALSTTLAKENSTVLTCPELFVDISTECLQPCEESTYLVRYCNLGDGLATGAVLKIKLDKDLSYLSATPNPTIIDGNELTFFLNGITPSFCGKVEIITELNCNAADGAGHCVEADITPNAFCELPDESWDQSTVDVTSKCEGDSVFIQFQNTGLEDMQDSAQFYIIIDDLIVMLESAQLQYEETIEIGFPANLGSVFFAEIGQSDFHPGASFPTTFLEGCPSGSNFTVGYLTQFPEDDQNRFRDVTCLQNTGTCPENEKIAFPSGFGDDHYINQNQPIEYQINFTNTTDQTQQDLIICDTLSPFLDPTTILEGAATHDYMVDIQGNILKINFFNINLPVDESGFVKFSINQIPNNPYGSVINNQASLIWGLETTTTNLVFHTIPEPLITNENINVCAGDTINGQVILTDITLSDTTQMSIFTSIVNTNVNVLDTTLTTQIASICEGGTFEYDGINLTETGSYPFVYEGSNGCDSTVVIDLTVQPNYQITLSEVITEGETFTVGMSNYSEAGLYVDSLQTNAGCDSIVTLNLLVVPFSLQDCMADAGADTFICQFTYPLIGQPAGGEWDIACDISDGQVAFENLSNDSLIVKFANCGSYHLQYQTTTIEEITVFDPILMDSVVVLDTCIAIDFVQIDVQDPSNLSFNANVGMDLQYNDYTCPESEDLWCKNFFEVDATNPEAIWKFVIDGGCITTIFEAVVGGTVNECVVAEIDYNIETSSGSFDPITICATQDDFASVDETNLEILENNFWEYLDGIIGQALANATVDCPPPPPNCDFPPEPIDSTQVDTIIRENPIRKGGFWTYQTSNGDFEPLSDTTFLSFNGQNHALVIQPSVTTYDGANFSLWGVQSNGDFVAPFTEASITFDWEEVWCMVPDTVYVYGGDGGKGGFGSLNVGPIPMPPDFGCGAFTIGFNKEMRVEDDIIACDESGYIVQLTIDGGYEPYTVFGLEGSLNGNIFTSELIPIEQPYAVTVKDSCICEVNLGGDACPCIGPQTYDYIVEMPCTDPCVDLFADFFVPTSHPIEITWGFGGSGSNLVVCDPGFYEFIVTDLVTGCSDEGYVNTYMDYPIAQIEASNTVINCEEPTQELCAIPENSFQDFAYFWDGMNINSPSDICQTVSSAGTYTVSVMNLINGCESSADITITEDLKAPTAIAGKDAQLDCFDNDILMDASASSPNNLSFDWASLDGNTLVNADSAITTTNQSGIYTLTVTNNDNGCTATDTLQVTPFPGISFAATAEETCWNEDNGSIKAFNIEGAAAPYSFSIDGINYQADTIFEDIGASDYQVFLQDGDGCLDSLIVNVPEVDPLPSITLEEEYHICNDSILLSLNNDFDPLSVEYFWSTGDTTPFIIANEETNYFVEVANKCEIQTHEFSITDDFTAWDFFQMPNVFTPNNDGTNDAFHPVRTLDPIPYEMTIFDRWGTKVYETNQDLPGWDGKMNGRNSPVGVYLWHLNATIENCAGTRQEVKLVGDVTLLR